MRSSDKDRLICIVMPAFNEGPVIGEILDQIPGNFRTGSGNFGLRTIVVDDASTDDTAAEVEKRDVILITHLINSGSGAATRTGLHQARVMGCDYAITMDADGQHTIKDAFRLLESAINNEADLVLGSRLVANKGNMPFHKKLGNLGLGIITYLVLGVYASDTQSGLKALNKKALSKLEFHSNDYAFCSEMIWKAHQNHLRIKEVPVEAIYTSYSLSRGQKNLSGALNITRQLLKRRLMDLFHG